MVKSIGTFMHTSTEENSGSAQIMQHFNGYYTSVVPKAKLQDGYRACNNKTSLCNAELALSMVMQMPFQDDHAYQKPASTVIGG